MTDREKTWRVLILLTVLAWLIVGGLAVALHLLIPPGDMP